MDASGLTAWPIADIMSAMNAARTATPLALRLAEIAARYRLDAIYAFGSRVDEIVARVAGQWSPSAHPTSDIDIGVLPQRGALVDPWERGGLVADLETAFDAPRVDVVIAPEASPFLALEVIRGERIHIADPDAEARFELYALRRAGDLAHFERARRATLRGKEVPW